MPKAESRSDNNRNDSKWQSGNDDLNSLMGIGALRVVNRWRHGYIDFKERCDSEREEREERKRQRMSQCQDRTNERKIESETRHAPFRAEWNEGFHEDDDEPKVKVKASKKKFKMKSTHSEKEERAINFNNYSQDDKCVIA